MPLPIWIFSWEIFVIFIGLIIGVRKSFKGIGWLILVLVGVFFLLDDIFMYRFELRPLIIPMILIIIGLAIVAKALNNNRLQAERVSRQNNEAANNAEKDYFNLSTVFGSTKRKERARPFTGGSALSIFGGTEIDLLEADIENIAVIDTFTLFGGTKIFVPNNWSIEFKSVTILGSLEDKRITSKSEVDKEKILVITGTTIFGGVEVRSV